MSGDNRKLAVGEELTFGQTYSDATIEKRLRIIDGANFEVDPSFVTTDELTGTRLESKDYKGILRGTGSFGFLGSPEGGLGWILKWLCGTVQTIAGDYKPRVKIGTASGGEDEMAFSAFTTNPVEADNSYCFLRHSDGTKTLLTEAASATPAAGEYYLDESGEKVYFGTALAAGDEVILSWFETVVGVYTHRFTIANNLKSFATTLLRGDVRKFNHKGCGMNQTTLNINTSDILVAECEALFQDEANEAAANWPTSPTSKLNVRDALDPFLIKHCRLLINQVENTDVQSFNLIYNNNLDPYDTIRCSDTTKRFVAGKVNLTVDIAQEFVDALTRDAFRNQTYRDFEVRYGDCPAPDAGVTIGTTGVTYKFGVWIPSGQYTSESVPVTSGVLAEDTSIKATNDLELNATYEFYLVNSVSGYPDAT